MRNCVVLFSFRKGQSFESNFTVDERLSSFDSWVSPPLICCKMILGREWNCLLHWCKWIMVCTTLGLLKNLVPHHRPIWKSPPHRFFFKMFNEKAPKEPPFAKCLRIHSAETHRALRGRTNRPGDLTKRSAKTARRTARGGGSLLRLAGRLRTIKMAAT